VSRPWVCGAVLLSVACGGSGASPAPQEMATTPEGAVRNFMQAVADSNITRMGRYWGTSRGPASTTGQPQDYVQRLSITQAFLRDSPFKVSKTDPVVNDPARQTVHLEFDRSDRDGKRCIRKVPFTVVNTGKQGWIVTAIDLTQVGTPGRSCTAPIPAAEPPKS